MGRDPRSSAVETDRGLFSFSFFSGNPRTRFWGISNQTAPVVSRVNPCPCLTGPGSRTQRMAFPPGQCLFLARRFVIIGGFCFCIPSLAACKARYCLSTCKRRETLSFLCNLAAAGDEARFFNGIVGPSIPHHPEPRGYTKSFLSIYVTLMYRTFGSCIQIDKAWSGRHRWVLC